MAFKIIRDHLGHRGQKFMFNKSLLFSQIKWYIHVTMLLIHGGGKTRLPKFKFSTKFLIGLHVIL